MNSKERANYFLSLIGEISRWQGERRKRIYTNVRRRKDKDGTKPSRRRKLHNDETLGSGTVRCRHLGEGNDRTDPVNGGYYCRKCKFWKQRDKTPIKNTQEYDRTVPWNIRAAYGRHMEVKKHGTAE